MGEDVPGGADDKTEGSRVLMNLCMPSEQAIDCWARQQPLLRDMPYKGVGEKAIEMLVQQGLADSTGPEDVVLFNLAGDATDTGKATPHQKALITVTPNTPFGITCTIQLRNVHDTGVAGLPELQDSTSQLQQACNVIRSPLVEMLRENS
jgi:hypothetical protein